MKLNLIACTAQRPDRRAIALCLVEIYNNMHGNLAVELTDILLEGDAVDIALNDKNTSSSLRALRKLDIDYEIVE